MSIRRKLKRGLVSLITGPLGLNVLPGGPLFGRRIERQKRIGYSRESDWKRLLPPARAAVIFDVGANVGQTALAFAGLYPQAAILSFEPGAEAYRDLCANTRDNPRIQPVNAALGAQDGQAELFLNGAHVTNSLLDNDAGAGLYVDPAFLAHRSTATVEVATLDRFCRDRNIARIDLLKIDAQGYELEILRGARLLIEDRSIPLIYLEVSFVPIYKDQPLFPEIYGYMLDKGYKLAGLYGACSNRNYLVSTDALFVLD